MPFLSLKNVSFSYPGPCVAVDTVNLEINRGENAAVVGQNGAGKTTMVKLCNRLLCPSTGDVIIGGRNTRDYTTAQIARIAGYVFQNPGDQIFRPTVESEVKAGPRMIRLPPERIQHLTEEALDITGLRQERREHPYNLPLAIRKFITIASVIAMDPELIIMDEPTAGQDVEGNRRLKNIIRAMLDRGKTLITISHNMDFVADTFSRVIVMADKRIILDGKPEDVFRDTEVLKKAALNRPAVNRICRRLGVGEDIIRMEDAVEAILQRRIPGT